MRRALHTILDVRACTCVIVVYIPQLQHLIPDPLDNIGIKPIAPIDLGSVLAHNTKTDSHRCDVLQPEVDPRSITGYHPIFNVVSRPFLKLNDFICFRYQTSLGLVMDQGSA